MNIPSNITRTSVQKNSIRTKGKIIDAQYEISVCKTVVYGPDATSSVPNVSGLLVQPAFTKSQWLNCQ